MRVEKFIVWVMAVGLGSTACDDTTRSDTLDDTRSDTDSMTNPDEGEDALEARYLSAIDDAIYADPEEISTDLIAITTEDPRVTWQNKGDESRALVVTWTSYPDSYPPGETVTAQWGDLWVTVSPELKERLLDEGATSSLRIAQLLGLPPNSAHSHFAQLWVAPTDLFRPAPDNEITDGVCGLALPEDAADWYVTWFEHNVFTSYFPPAYPWTRLGYTYDWAPGADEQGLSEFVVMQGASFVVESLATTEEYLAD